MKFSISPSWAISNARGKILVALFMLSLLISSLADIDKVFGNYDRVLEVSFIVAIFIMFTILVIYIIAALELLRRTNKKLPSATIEASLLMLGSKKYELTEYESFMISDNTLILEPALKETAKVEVDLSSMTHQSANEFVREIRRQISKGNRNRSNVNHESPLIGQ